VSASSHPRILALDTLGEACMDVCVQAAMLARVLQRASIRLMWMASEQRSQ
jgi:hypothetical protein